MAHYLIIMVIALIVALIFGFRIERLNRRRWKTISKDHHVIKEREFELMKKRYGHPYPKRNVVVMDQKGQSERVGIYE